MIDTRTCAFPGGHEHDHEMCIDALTERAAHDHGLALVEHAERGHTRPLASWSDSMLRDELRVIAHAIQADDGQHYDSLMSQDRMVRNEITFRGAVSSF